MRRVGPADKSPDPEDADLSIATASPLQMLVAGGILSVLGLSSFMIGFYGSDAFSYPAPRPALAEMSTHAAPTAKPAVQVAVAKAEAEPVAASAEEGFAPSVETSDSAASDEIVPDEKIPDNSKRPPKPTEPPSDTSAGFVPSDDPWAALDQTDPSADAGDASTAAPTEEPPPANP